jgi:GTP-binding protein
VAALPVIAIVGRPNVGKSTLFNRILGARAAIVEDQARTTRDRLYGNAEWNDRRFLVVDTGGLEARPGDAIEERVQEQAHLAIAEADVILFVVDAVTGPTPADQEAATLLRGARAPVIVAVNKVDNARRELDAAEFHSFGWDETYAISASHGRGTGDLMDAIVAALPRESEAELARKAREREAEAFERDVAQGRLEAFVVGVEDGEGEVTDGAGEAEATETGRPEPGRRWDTEIALASAESPVAIAIVGRPNVGKSSLVNALIGEERVIVSEIPGTTRDAIDTSLAWGRGEIVLIDTAGIRRRGRVASGPAAERYSTLRALKAIARADVAVLVLDAADGLTAQDAHVAGYVVEEGKGLVLAINKWDAVEKTDKTFDEYVRRLRRAAPFLDFASIVSISATSRQRVERVLELAVDAWAERRRRIGTGEVNRLLRVAVDRQAPPLVRGRRPKILYGTQVAIAPPTFVCFVSGASDLHFSYRRYLENRIREAYGFDGTPIRIHIRERESDPSRRRGGRAKARR